MCTIGYHRELGIIFKNRDKTETIAEELVQDDYFIACRSPQADYYSWGMNVHGCAFVTAAINSPHWTQLVYEGNMRAAEIAAKEENAELKNPAAIISSLLPDVREIGSWVEALVLQPFLSRGYNLLLADSRQSVVVESYQDKRSTRKLQDRVALTNHFQKLQHGPKILADYPSSFRRHEYANSQLSIIHTLDEVMEMLKPSDPQLRKQIWRSGPFSTISTSIIDFRHSRIYYSRNIEKPYLALDIKK